MEVGQDPLAVAAPDAAALAAVVTNCSAFHSPHAVLEPPVETGRLRPFTEYVVRGLQV